MSTLAQAIPAHFFAPRRASGRFSMRGHDYEVELDLPSLADASKTAWADWGPMCRCRLEAGARVELTYREPSAGKRATYVVAPPSICLNAPFRADERRRHPFYVQVVDAARGLNFEVYLDAAGRATRVDVAALNACLDVPGLIFAEAERVVGSTVHGHGRPAGRQADLEAGATPGG